ncbi:unnamed protein product, partial [Hymenolepis diminuta]
MVSLLGIQDTPDLITDLFMKGIAIPIGWRRCLAAGLKTAMEQPIASSSMPSSSIEANGQSPESQERLAIFEHKANTTRVCILNPECTEVEIEHQLPLRGYTNIFPFQNKLVFIGDWLSEKEPGSRRVDLMDLSTGQVSPLPDMMNAICSPVGVGTENEIFVFGTEILSDSPERFSNEVYEVASGKWSLLPPMIEERSRCAVVNIPDSGIL